MNQEQKTILKLLELKTKLEGNLITDNVFIQNCLYVLSEFKRLEGT